MLNAIAEIGNIVSKGSKSDFIEFLVPETTNHKHLIGLNFDLKDQSLNIKYLFSSKDTLPKEKLASFLYIGNESAHRPQFSPTTDNLSYLITQSLFNLSDMLPESSNLKVKTNSALSIFFEKEVEGKKIVPLLKESFLSDYGIKFKRKESNKLKDDIKNYSREITTAISNELNIKAKETLFTILLNGEPVAQHPDYREFLKEKTLESAFERERNGICSICGDKKPISQDTTRFQFKFYMIDKVSFASEFNKNNFYKSLSLCRDCYKKLVIGEKWINQNLRTRLGGFNIYIIPQLMWPSIEARKLLRILKSMPQSFNEIKNIKSLREIELDSIRKRERTITLHENPFTWNFLFYRKAHSAFKILTLIKDIPPSRILKLYTLVNEADKIRQKFFPERIGFDLDQIFWLIPIKKSKGDYNEYKKILQIYYNIFSEYPLHHNQLYQFYTDLAHIHRFESYELFQIGRPHNPDYSLMIDTVKWNLFLFFLRKLNLINGGISMTNDHLAEYFPDRVKEYMDRMGYNITQKGLALLGYVMGVVAYAQYKSGLQNKPILEKVNYQGMTDEKIIRLFNDLFEKIRQYKVGYAERWWAAAKELYESGKDEQITSQERVFYLLSGYALNVLHTGKDENTIEIEKNENIQEGVDHE